MYLESLGHLGDYREWNGLFCSGMLILETNFRCCIWDIFEIKISATSPLSTIVLSPSRNMVWFPFLNFLSETKGDIVRQKVLSCLVQLFSKYFAIYFFAQWHHMVSQAPILLYFLPNVRIFFASHIVAIKRFAQFGVHIWYWLSLDKLGLYGCMMWYICVTPWE